MGYTRAQRNARMGAVSVESLAKLLGVAPTTIYTAIDDGRITRPADGLLNADKAMAEYRANTAPGGDPCAAPDDSGGVDGGGESFAAARTRKERAGADLAELKAAEARAAVVSTEAAAAVWFAAARILRERLLAISTRIEAPAATRAAVHAEVVAALAELPDTPPAVAS